MRVGVKVSVGVKAQGWVGVRVLGFRIRVDTLLLSLFVGVTPMMGKVSDRGRKFLL